MTPGTVAVDRAQNAVAKLDACFEAMRKNGQLAEFNRQYKRRRMAAGLRGEGFMSFKIAMARLKRALIPILLGGGQPAIGATLFATVFDC